MRCIYFREILYLQNFVIIIFLYIIWKQKKLIQVEIPHKASISNKEYSFRKHQNLELCEAVA